MYVRECVLDERQRRAQQFLESAELPGPIWTTTVAWMAMYRMADITKIHAALRDRLRMGC
jgi:hypothetical protein